MEKAYEKITWKDYPSVETPINAENLNKMSDALEEIDNRVVVIDIKTSNEKKLENTMYGGLKFNSISGKSVQEGTPTLENPQEIKSVEIAEITSCGKNLYDRTKDSDRTNVGVTSTITNRQTMILNGTGTADGAQPKITVGSQKIKVTSGTKLTLSAKVISGSAKIASNTVIAFLSIFYGENYAESTSFNVSSSVSNIDKNTVFTPITITVTEDMLNNGYLVYNIQTYLRIGDVYNNLEIGVQLEIGDMATEWKPYEHTKAILSNSLILRSIDNYKDQLVKKDGVWGVSRIIKRKVIDGTTLKCTYVDKNVQDYTGGKQLIQMNLGYSTEYPNANEVFPKINKFKVVSFSEKDEDTALWYKYASTGLHIPIVYLSYEKYGSVITDIATANTWLQSNNVTIDYVLAKAEFEPLAAVEQVAINALKTFDDVTNIIINSEIQPEIEVEYGQSKVGAYTLQGLLLAESNELRINEQASVITELETLATEVEQ